ncbi:MAG: HAD-IIIA family hydrolase [Lachnospiraceae bacterium]|nr:HAD-IIIA family hydrolase [Lachnospiraceae bacterium]
MDTVIFDLDGTLLNTLEDLTDSVNHAMEEFGFPLHTIEEIRSFVGNGAPTLIERSIPQGKENPSYDAVLAAFKEHYAAHCEDKTNPYEGIMELLAQLKEKGYRMAVVSNKFDGAVKRLCGKYFGDYIEAAIGESADVKRKPAPDTVYQALRELSCDASRAVYVGDSEVDIQTAKNASLPCISVTWGFRTEERLKDAGADGKLMIRTPQELVPLLLKLQGEG